MKICIAQIKSIKGQIEINLKKHLQVVKNAIALNADLVIFPELSITGYEPSLAKELSIQTNDIRFQPFQELSDKYGISIGLGIPIESNDGTLISMFIFQPNEKIITYSKQSLHTDELPYFIKGDKQVFIEVKKEKIAFGICFEALLRSHFLNANLNKASIYIASVAKPQKNIEKAYQHFSEIANEFKTPVLMSNSVGNSDNFVSAGQSAIWNKDGNLVDKLDDKNEGFLIYDTALDSVYRHQPRIEKANLSNLKEVFQIYQNGKSKLQANKIFQWTDNYPTVSIIESDLKKGILYVLKLNEEIIGAVNLSEEQEKEYETIDWQFNDSKVLVIHRLVVDPKHQGKGYANTLMDFAENFAEINNYSSIRLDAYSQNENIIRFYTKRNYIIRGNVMFPERKFPFHCMERKVSSTSLK